MPRHCFYDFFSLSRALDASEYNSSKDGNEEAEYSQVDQSGEEETISEEELAKQEKEAEKEVVSEEE